MSENSNIDKLPYISCSTYGYDVIFTINKDNFHDIYLFLIYTTLTNRDYSWINYTIDIIATDKEDQDTADKVTSYRNKGLDIKLPFNGLMYAKNPTCVSDFKNPLEYYESYEEMLEENKFNINYFK